MNRRNFFAFLPLSPLVLAGAAEAAAKPDIIEGAPAGSTPQLTLMGPEPVKKTSLSGLSLNNDLMYLSNGPLSTNKDRPAVSMGVGEDGHLWLKTKDGQWKRVVTE